MLKAKKLDQIVRNKYTPVAHDAARAHVQILSKTTRKVKFALFEHEEHQCRVRLFVHDLFHDTITFENEYFYACMRNRYGININFICSTSLYNARTNEFIVAYGMNDYYAGFASCRAYQGMVGRSLDDKAAERYSMELCSGLIYDYDDNKMILYGGTCICDRTTWREATATTNGNMLIYDFDMEQITEVKDCPIDACRAFLTFRDDCRFIVFGGSQGFGENHELVKVQDIYQYDMLTQEWKCKSQSTAQKPIKVPITCQPIVYNDHVLLLNEDCGWKRPLKKNNGSKWQKFNINVPLSKKQDKLPMCAYSPIVNVLGFALVYMISGNGSIYLISLNDMDFVMPLKLHLICQRQVLTDIAIVCNS